jgi:hypothetical protein
MLPWLAALALLPALAAAQPERGLIDQPDCRPNTSAPRRPAWAGLTPPRQRRARVFGRRTPCRRSASHGPRRRVLPCPLRRPHPPRGCRRSSP